MKKESERQIQIRSEMTRLLFETASRDGQRLRSTGILETANTYGLFIILVASALIVWNVGKPDSQLTVLMALQAIVLGGIVIFASELKLATRLSSLIRSIAKHIAGWHN